MRPPTVISMQRRELMKVAGFQLLVDAYNDVPYTEALQGANKLSPAYSDAKEIYKELASQLDTAYKHH